MAEIHRSPQNQGRGRNFSKRLRSMFTKSRLAEPMGANHKVEENIVAFELCDKGSFNKNNNSGCASPSPTSWLPISSRDFNAWPSGSKTPPLNSFCSVPFKWEEAPGKAKHSPVDDQLINSDEVQGRFCRWDCDDDEGFDLSVFKVADGAVGFDVEERLVAIYAATPSYHKSGNDHITSQRRSRRPILRKLFGALLGRVRSAIDLARRIW